ncbi:MAG: ADP-forming succinate--CoA ligase subunit beta [Chloroflexi bacterium]|nr:MAG: ADP-forming succinate--CoA ligase subunit beta [Chloroflexota bacterium]
MKLHEYQAKELLARYGVPVPASQVARTPEEAQRAAEALGGKVVVKAQVHAGGRGKAGGVKLCATPAEARAAAEALLGTRLVTGQSGPGGQPINEVLVEEAVDIARELYLGIVIDNSAGMPLVICSAAGGMEIEEVAEHSPDQIHRQLIDPTVGFQGYQARALAFATGLEGDLNRPAVALITALAKAFVECDGTLAEINPLVVTTDGRLLAADAKFSVDDNADYRHADLFKLQDKTQDDALEVEAKDSGIENYVKLDGNIGCLVNGAGLAMATMDAIQFEGGMPANFLDIGTQNDPAAVAAALKIIGADPNVKAVLVNIFGGLARTDVIAEGVVQAKRGGLLPQPTVVRLAGTNVEAGMKILDDSGLDLIRADGFAEAASKVVQAAG